MSIKVRDRKGVRWVDENTLRQQLGIPNTQNMAIERGNREVQRLQQGDYIDPNDDIIEMIPVIKQGSFGNAQRIVEDSLTLGNQFSVEMDSDLRWIMIQDFLTPPAYIPDLIPVLMMIPPDYPQSPPGLGHHNVYLRKGLRRDDGKNIRHFYRKVVYCKRGCCDFSNKGWYWWCFQDIKWDPRLNDFLSIARALYVCMDEV